MAVDSSVVAALAGAAGVVVAKMLDLMLERFRAQHADKLDARSAMSQASAQLFDQQGVAITDLRKQLAETQEREHRYRQENATLREKVTDLEADVRRLPRLEQEVRELRLENDRQQEQISELLVRVRRLGRDA